MLLLHQVATGLGTLRGLLLHHGLQGQAALPIGVCAANLANALVLNARRGCRASQGRLPGKGQQQTRRAQRRQQRGTTVGDKGQRHANHRQNTGHHTHIDDGLRGQPHHNAARRQAHQRIGGAQHDTHRTVHQTHVQQQNRHRAQKAQFLANNRENVVVVGLCQVVVLLARLAQANTQEATGRQRHLTRVRLITVSVRARTPDAEDTGHSVRATQNAQQGQHGNRAANLQH